MTRKVVAATVWDHWFEVNRTLRVYTLSSFRSPSGHSQPPPLPDGPCLCTTAQVWGQCSCATLLAAARTAFFIFLWNNFVSLLLSITQKQQSPVKPAGFSATQAVKQTRKQHYIKHRFLPKKRFLFISKSVLPKHTYAQFSLRLLNRPLQVQHGWCWCSWNPPQPCSGTV